jgi:hypothetical protein
MPDDELLEAAEAGMLRDSAVVEDEARRMLDDWRAATVIVKFHHELFEVSKFLGIKPSRSKFPFVSDELGAHAVRENELFIREIVLGRSGSYVDLLTSQETFANAELAAIYGLDGDFGPEFVPVTLDRGLRQGMFTQVGFLASNASSVDSDPIHRGVFLAERVACMAIGAPPDGVPPLPALEPGQTNRERIEAHTEQEGTVCQLCHETIINPFGFALEYYNAIGATQFEDNGKPIDGNAEILIGSESAKVENPFDLVEALAASRVVHECYARHWVEYAFGRAHASEDEPLVERLGQESLEQASIKDMMVSLVTSQPFLSRAQEELQ